MSLYADTKLFTDDLNALLSEILYHFIGMLYMLPNMDWNFGKFIIVYILSTSW